MLTVDVWFSAFSHLAERSTFEISYCSWFSLSVNPSAIRASSLLSFHGSILSEFKWKEELRLAWE